MNVAKELVPALADYTKLLADAQDGSRVQIEAKEHLEKGIARSFKKGLQVGKF